jgi:ankyrin repeat protein
MAVKRDLYAMAILFIKYGSDVNARDSSGRSALFYATNNENPEIMSLLLAMHASVFALDNRNEPILKTHKQSLHKTEEEKEKELQ